LEGAEVVAILLGAGASPHVAGERAWVVTTHQLLLFLVGRCLSIDCVIL
jgi:hypothetical protein